MVGEFVQLPQLRPASSIIVTEWNKVGINVVINKTSGTTVDKIQNQCNFGITDIVSESLD